MIKPFRFILFFLLVTCFSCEEILLESDISDQTVTLVAPSNEATFTSTGITFSWEAVEDADEYRIQIARPNFENPLEIVVDELTEETFSTQQLNIGTYQWRVKAINSAYETAFTTRTINVISNEDFQNNTVILSSPVSNLITNTNVQNLSWQPVIGAVSYELQITNSSNVFILDQTLTNTNYNYTFADGSFEWRVRASNGTLQTLFSSRSILVDTTAPNTPVLSLPANNSTIVENDVTFSWTRTAINGSNENDTIKIYSDIGLTNLIEESQNTSPFTTNLDDGTYYWIVIASDEAGNTSSQSTTFKVTIN
ncbi:Ig-like domain-containing protein [Flavobacterium sp.]|uniref:Ig-like domain-containing protein n=1 Tax=Flavobacterium sp. TaxID=239 RepID=UPI0039E42536